MNVEFGQIIGDLDTGALVTGNFVYAESLMVVYSADFQTEDEVKECRIMIRFSGTANITNEEVSMVFVVSPDTVGRLTAAMTNAVEHMGDTQAAEEFMAAYNEVNEVNR